MKTPEAMKAYGRTILCKNILKPFYGKIDRNKGKEENKKENKGKHDKKEHEIKTKDKGKKDETKEKEPYVPGLLEIPRFNIKEIENNPLDSLPASKFDLEKFKQDFLKNTNKKGAMKNFWKNYDPEGYSLWYIEYNNDPNEYPSGS